MLKRQDPESLDRKYWSDLVALFRQGKLGYLSVLISQICSIQVIIGGNKQQQRYALVTVTAMCLLQTTAVVLHALLVKGCGRYKT